MARSYFTCPQCKQTVSVLPEDVGKKRPCPTCGTEFLVPNGHAGTVPGPRAGPAAGADKAGELRRADHGAPPVGASSARMTRDRAAAPVPLDVRWSSPVAQALGPEDAGHGHGGMNMVDALRRRWLIALVAAVGVCVIGLPLLWLLSAPEYTAFADIKIEPVVPHLIYSEESAKISGYSSFVNTQARIITSPTIIEPTLADPAVRSLAYVREMKDTAAEMRKNLRATPLRGTHFLRVTMTGTEPRALPTIVNVAIAQYMKLEASREESDEEKTLRALKKELEGVSAKLENLHKTQRVLAREYGTTHLEGRQEIALQRLQALQEEATRLETERIALEAQEKRLERKQDEEPDPANRAQLERAYISADPLVKLYRSSLAEFERREQLGGLDKEVELRAQIRQKEQEYEQAVVAREQELASRIERLEEEYEQAALKTERDLGERIAATKQQLGLWELRYTSEARQIRTLMRDLEGLKKQLAEIQKTPVAERSPTPDMQAKRRTIDALEADLKGLRQRPVDERIESPAMRAARLAKIDLEGELDRLRKAPADQRGETQEQRTNREAIETLKKTLADRELKLRQEFAGKELKFVKVTQQEQRQEALEEVRNRLADVEDHEKRLNELIKKQDDAAIALGRKDLDFKKHEVEIGFTTGLYQALRQRIQALELERGRPVARITDPYEAEVPSAPAKDKRKKFSIVLVMGAALFGCAFAVFLERVRPRVTGPRDAEAQCDLKVLGTTPRFKDLVSARIEPRHLLEDCQSIWVNLRLASGNGRARTLVVASPGADDGKTTFAINLATSMALAGTRVLLVDGDLGKPDVARYLKVDDAKGLADVLAGECSTDEAIQTTSVPGLDVLPGAGHADRRTELLTNGRLAPTLTHLESRYEAIVIDTPAVLAIPDAKLWATVADAVMFVARSGQTGTRELKQANSRMQEAGASVVGVVVTDVRQRDSYDYYAHRYRYREETKGQPTSEGESVFILPAELDLNGKKGRKGLETDSDETAEG